MWYLIGLACLALIGGMIWSYNKKREKREAERAMQAAELLAALQEGVRKPATNTAADAATPVAAAPADTVPVAVVQAAAPAPELGKKQRLLQQPKALLYYLFRTGLPDHEIFANLTLADVIDVAPIAQAYEREQKARRLAQLRLDFVVCTKQLEVVAAVVINNSAPPDTAQAENSRFIEESLRIAGIRLVRIDAAALPRHHQVRELVYDVAS